MTVMQRAAPSPDQPPSAPRALTQGESTSEYEVMSPSSRTTAVSNWTPAAGRCRAVVQRPRLCGVSCTDGTSRPLSVAFQPTEHVDVVSELVGERNHSDWLLKNQISLCEERIKASARCCRFSSSPVTFTTFYQTYS